MASPTARWSPFSSQSRVRVAHQFLELRREPVPGKRRVGQSTAQIVAVAGVTGVLRVAHLVEALALVVRDRLAGTVGLSWRLDPNVRVDTLGWGGLRTLAETGAALVAPVAGLDAAVDTGLVDERVDVGRGTGAGRPIGAAPPVAGGVDEHADAGAEAVRNQLVPERLRERQLVDVVVPVDPLGLPDRGPVDGGVDGDVRLGQRRVVRRIGDEAVHGGNAARG